MAHVETSKDEVNAGGTLFPGSIEGDRRFKIGFYVLYILCSRERKARVIRGRTGETKTFKRVQRQVK